MPENDFFKISHDEYSYNTPYLQHCTVKKMTLKIFFLKEFSSAAPTHSNRLRTWGSGSLVESK